VFFFPPFPLFWYFFRRPGWWQWRLTFPVFGRRNERILALLPRDPLCFFSNWDNGEFTGASTFPPLCDADNGGGFLLFPLIGPFAAKGAASGGCSTFQIQTSGSGPWRLLFFLPSSRLGMMESRRAVFYSALLRHPPPTARCSASPPSSLPLFE